MTAGHLVAGLKLALHGDEDLDHLEHAGRQLVAALQLLDLVLEALLEQIDPLVELLLHRLDIDHPRLVGDGDLPPLATGEAAQHLVGDDLTGADAARPADDLLTVEQIAKLAIGVAFQNRALVVAVLGQAVDLFTLDRQRALVLVDATTREHPHLDDRAGHSRRDTQRGVADIRRGLPHRHSGCRG